MVSPNLILFGVSLTLRLIDKTEVVFCPIDSAEFFNRRFHDGVLSVEYARAKKPCFEHHQDMRKCLVKCGNEYNYLWMKFYPLTSIVEIVERKV
jgi:hypothetical protein